MNDHNPPHSQFAERLNSVAIWTFPIALLSIFLFVSVNVVYSNDDKFKATSAAELRDVRCKPAASGTQHRIPAKAEYRCNSGTASTGDASPKASESTGQGLESTNPPLN